MHLHMMMMMMMMVVMVVVMVIMIRYLVVVMIALTYGVFSSKTDPVIRPITDTGVGSTLEHLPNFTYKRLDKSSSTGVHLSDWPTVTPFKVPVNLHLCTPHFFVSDESSTCDLESDNLSFSPLELF